MSLYKPFVSASLFHADTIKDLMALAVIIDKDDLYIQGNSGVIVELDDYSRELSHREVRAIAHTCTLTKFRDFIEYNQVQVMRINQVKNLLNSFPAGELRFHALELSAKMQEFKTFIAGLNTQANLFNQKLSASIASEFLGVEPEVIRRSFERVLD
jgi:hypothetical protein